MLFQNIVLSGKIFMLHVYFEVIISEYNWKYYFPMLSFSNILYFQSIILNIGNFIYIFRIITSKYSSNDFSVAYFSNILFKRIIFKTINIILCF